MCQTDPVFLFFLPGLQAKASGEGLMIVHDGVLAVYSNYNRELGHLIDGDYFGALSLVTDKEVYMTYVVAVTNSTVRL